VSHTLQGYIPLIDFQALNSCATNKRIEINYDLTFKYFTLFRQFVVLSFVLWNRKEYYVHKKHIILNGKKHIRFIWTTVYRRQLK